jgi:hypothetical protein
MREQFPNVRPFQKQAREALRDAQTIRPAQAKGYAYGTIGTALDYRVRYYFAVTPSDQFIAYIGAMRVAMLAADMADAFHDNLCPALDSLAKEINPVARRLGREDEDRLNRHCIVLALFDELYRTGMAYADSSPLMQSNSDEYEDWLAIPKPEWLDDLRQLSWLFQERGSGLVEKTATLNPEFEGSRDIGGADADIIVANRLLEIKASVDPNGGRIKRWLYQALGYVLLDYDDRHKLTGMDLYLARQGVFLRWPLNEAIETLADGKAPPLQELRDQFRDTILSTR